MGQEAGELGRDAELEGDSDSGYARPASYATENLDDSTETAAPEEIRAQIEQTRSDMSQTIDAIQAKLSPDNLKDQAKEVVREATIGRAEEMVSNATDQARGFGASVMDTIRENPMPAALAGLGLAWLFMKRSSNQGGDQGRGGYSNMGSSVRYSSRGYSGNGGYGGYDTADRGTGGGRYPQQGPGLGDRLGEARSAVGDAAGQAGSKLADVRDSVGDAAGQASGKVGDVVGQAGDAVSQAGSKVGDLASQTGDKVGELGNQVQDKAQEATDRFQQALIDNPLAVGAVALALGAALGFVVPETQQEHKLLGQARDQIMDKAQGVVQDTMQKVQQVADAAGQTVQEEAKQQGLAPQQ